MKKNIVPILLLSSFLIFNSCSQRIGDFTIISTKNIEVGAQYTKIGSGTAEDMKVYFLFPLGEPSIETAVDNLLESEKGELLTDAVVTSHFNVFLVVGKFGYSVKADVWKKAEIGLNKDADEIFELSQIDGEYFLQSKKSNEKIFQVKFHQ